MEQKQLLREAGIEPTNEIIALGLGAANDAYLQFMEEIKRRGIEVNWRYYKDGNAWLGKALYKWTTSRGTQKETTAFWLSIWEGFFKVGIMIPERCRAEALSLPTSNETKQMIESAQQIGKLKLFSLGFDLHSNELFDDVYALIELRKTLK